MTSETNTETCAGCGGPLPPGKRSHARHCNARCRKTAARSRARSVTVEEAAGRIAEAEMSAYLTQLQSVPEVAGSKGESVPNMPTRSSARRPMTHEVEASEVLSFEVMTADRVSGDALRAKNTLDQDHPGAGIGGPGGSPNQAVGATVHDPGMLERLDQDRARSDALWEQYRANLDNAKETA